MATSGCPNKEPDMEVGGGVERKNFNLPLTCDFFFKDLLQLYECR